MRVINDFFCSSVKGLLFNKSKLLKDNYKTIGLTAPRGKKHASGYFVRLGFYEFISHVCCDLHSSGDLINNTER